MRELETVDQKPLRVMFMDEGRFGRVDLPQRCWAPRSVRPGCPSLIIREYSYAFAALSPSDGRLESLIYSRADSDVMSFFLKQIAGEFQDEHVVIFMDRAAWHTTGRLAVPDNISLEFLPAYSPQLNPVEVLWKELRKDHFHNKVFDSMNAVDDRLEEGLRNMAIDQTRVRSFSAFSWMCL